MSLGGLAFCALLFGFDFVTCIRLSGCKKEGKRVRDDRHPRALSPSTLSRS